ncbi:formyltransferase family protein [Ruminococcus sp. 5_1_39BFAA]|uniref:formyltransferase family protein n=1 Tax=Ruminococcus sp. 5_1_39BFAA TaxID=457412 RepID=UPI00356B3C7B
MTETGSRFDVLCGSRSVYDRIILLGTGKLFLDCMEYTSRLGVPYAGYDMSEKTQKVTRAQAADKGLSYFQIEKKLIYEELRNAGERILLLSVINPCIIPGDILDRENITAYNCHQALLPRHKGRNAEAWALFSGDTETGITWHRMTAAVDGGDILIQKKIPISETATSFQIFRRQLEAAYEAFTEFMPQVLAGEETCSRQEDISDGDFHYSWEIPGDGYLDLSWSGEKISRFLRSMDYGILKTMPSPRVFHEGKTYTFKSSRIERTSGESEEQVLFESKYITIIKQDYKFTLLKYKEENDNERAVD